MNATQREGETLPLGSTEGEPDSASVFSSVLLVEDERAHAELIKRALRDLVGEITHVSSGREALQAVNTTFCDLVLCDLRLGDMTGIDVLRGIRAARPSLPVVVLTSSNSLDDAVSVMREGASDYTTKQFSDDFNERMRLIVARLAERQLQLAREQRLRSERQSFWAAVRAARDGVAIISDRSTVLFANEAFNNFVRACCGVVPQDEALNLVDALASHDHSVARALSQQLQGGHTDALWNAEVEITTKAPSGQTHQRYFDIALSTVTFEELRELSFAGNTLSASSRYIVWIRDISRRKEQERFQRDLLATTTHDLKGPLGAILTSAELLSDGDILQSDKAASLIMRIASCARNSINIIDELLSARRIQDGVLVVRPRMYPLAEAIEDVVLDYLPVAKSHGVEMVVPPIAENIQVYADRIGLSRILSNLVSNAIKYTPRGGVVEISAEATNTGVRISIADTGRGIEAKDLHLLFEKYTRLEEHHQIEGTGLGLYVTKNIVDAHGGKIEVFSEIGSGTTFVVTLPNPADRTTA